jgi:mono/diheme cytochrome c family protein
MGYPRQRLLAVALSGLVVGLTSTGCGTESADSTRGRMLFIQKCGTCHQLAQAGTKAQVGPDLDRAFAAARQVGFDSDTVEGIVSNQIEHPRSQGITEYGPGMPADLVTGQDRINVSAYVAKWAGVPGAAPPRVPGGPGAQVFANNGCAGCHTLAEAQAGGTVGPNLDQSIPDQSKATIEESIVEPDAKIAQGYPPNVMPSNYEQIIPQAELKELVGFLAATKQGGSGNGP